MKLKNPLSRFFGKPEPTYKMFSVNCGGREVDILGNSENNCVWVPQGCYGELVGAIGSYLGGNPLSSERKRVETRKKDGKDVKYFCFPLTTKQYALLESFEETKAKKERALAAERARFEQPKIHPWEDGNHEGKWRVDPTLTRRKRNFPGDYSTKGRAYYSP